MLMFWYPQAELYEELARIFSEENNQLNQRELLMKEGTAKHAQTAHASDRHLHKALEKLTMNPLVSIFYSNCFHYYIYIYLCLGTRFQHHATLYHFFSCYFRVGVMAPFHTWVLSSRTWQWLTRPYLTQLLTDSSTLTRNARSSRFWHRWVIYLWQMLLL